MILNPADEQKRTLNPRSPEPELRRQSPEEGSTTEDASQLTAVSSPKVDPLKEWLDKVLVPAMVRI
jgi:hypothetical protein